MADSQSGSTSNSTTALGTAGMAAVLVWGLKCWQAHQIVTPDESVIVMVAGFFVPIGYAIKGIISIIFQRIFGKSLAQLEQEGKT